MQDSLEDYIQISKNCKKSPPEVRNEVLITNHVKKECNAKAMQILHFAIEGKMRSDAFLKCLPYINQSHYQDIVEERAITKLCGYPLCSKRIPDMPKKQYYISTKNNKVYDITERKNYCSNICYRASIHIKAQIDTSPLWLRKYNERPNFTLLSKTEKGLPGEVVDQGITKPLVEPLFTSVSAFTQMSLDEADELELKEEEEETKKQCKRSKKIQKSVMKTINENEEEDQLEIENSPIPNENYNKKESDRETNENVGDNVIQVADHSKSQKIESILNLEADKNKYNLSDVEAYIYKCFKEWLTLETYMFVYGEESIKEKLNDAKMSQYFETLKISELQTEQQKRYTEICRKLHLRELADEKFDANVIGNERLKPIPDYKQLKEESKELNLKVKSFYSGDLHIQEDSNFASSKKESQSKDEEEEGPPAVLPLVDVNSQNALRRKIFLNSLNKTIQLLFQTLQLSPNLVLSDLQALVKTFKLKADNIVFKPGLWNYIAIILLKILSLRNEKVKASLDLDKSKLHIEHWLSSLPNKKKLVIDVIELLKDVNSFVEQYITNM